jgi:hypothetical protein
MTRGGLDELLLPKVKISAKPAVFHPVFYIHTENLPAMEMGGRLSL